MTSRTRPLEIGVTPWTGRAAERLPTIVDHARYADELGFHSFFLPESHFVGEMANPQPLLVLSAVAAATRQIRLGTTSYLLPVRNALQSAEAVAVLDQLSQGRVILGLGRGFRPALFAAFGIAVKQKREIFDASLEIMIRAWSGEAIRVGEDGHQHEVVLSPLPVQRPHPPLWVAAFGPKALRQVGRLGLPYLASPLEPIGRLERNAEVHREALAEYSQSDSIAVPLMRNVFVDTEGNRSGEIKDRLRAQATRMARGAGRLVDESEVSDVDSWAIVGELDEVRERIGDYVDRFGMTHLIASPRVPGTQEEDVRASLRSLSSLHQS